ncbi:c-type cytochrome [Thalassotalea sp. PP2-459]|uniref:c-type cytochrome n=1 Tax=Thalassotalea sp. PP2-459 TaxID=1742724 RepID=UPI000945C631|nr:c-type cytochrome [Thalassotalea sp. PP2-459]OKY27835.1 cytochrome c, diheme subunit of cytochrome bc complex peta [Thalassotalea sp. PP2-459]
MYKQILFLLTLSTMLSKVIIAQEYETIEPPRKLTEKQAEIAEKNYLQYCALCHGKDRQGHVNDHAPSLKSASLFQSGVPHAILRPMSYGRTGTPMGGYLDEVGGPMTLEETWNLTYWLFEKSGVDRVKLSTNPVQGDIKKGERVYQKECSTCHGINGEGITAPALGNPSALAHNTDEFIRYAIRHGRQNTPMKAYQGILPEQSINDITAFLRSKASGWQDNKPVLKQLPTPAEYVVNPEGEHPNFTLKDDQYVMAEDLYKALEKKQKMVLFDTRVTSVWQTAHIKGSVPLPYYADLDAMIADIPTDVQIVAYCSCPRAAADHVVNKLRHKGFTKTAVLWEGIFGWMHLGFPVTRGDLSTLD